MGKVQYWWCMLGLKYPLVQYFKESNLQPNEIYLWTKTNDVSLTLNLRWAFQSIHFSKDYFFFFGGPFSKSFLNLLQYCFCFMFWFLDFQLCGILGPWPGIELVGPASEGEVWITGPPGMFHSIHSCLHHIALTFLISYGFVFFFFKWPPNADQDGFLFSSFSAYKSREVRGTEWRPNGCKLAEHPLQEKMQDIHAPYCYFGRNPLCHWTCCRLLSPWTNWQSRNMQLFASIWERGKDTFLRLR